MRQPPQPRKDNDWLKSRIAFSCFMTASIALSKGGLYAAATYDSSRALGVLIPRSYINPDTLAVYGWNASLFVTICTSIRTATVYGPQIWLTFAGRDRHQPQASTALTHLLVQGTSIGTAISGFVGTQYIMTGLLSIPSNSGFTWGVSIWMLLSNYVGEYGLGGRSLRQSLNQGNLNGHLGALRTAYHNLTNSNQPLCKKFIKSCILIFQSLDETMAMAFFFFRLAAHHRQIPSTALLILGVYSAVSTGIRTLVLYAPRMGLTWQANDTAPTHDGRYHDRTKCMSFCVAAIIVSISACAKMLASFDGYYDTAQSQNWLPDILDYDSLNKIIIFGSLGLVLSSALTAEIYFSFNDVKDAGNFIIQPMSNCYDSLFKTRNEERQRRSSSDYHSIMDQRGDGIIGYNG
jgi:hypothetical protein